MATASSGRTSSRVKMRSCLGCMWGKPPWGWWCTTTTLRRWWWSSSRPGTSPSSHSHLGMVQPVGCLQGCLPLHRWEHNVKIKPQFSPQSRRLDLWCVVRVRVRKVDRPSFPLPTCSQCGRCRSKANGGSKPRGSGRGGRHIEQLGVPLLGLRLTGTGKTDGDKKKDVKKHLEQRWNWCQPAPFSLIAAPGSDQHNSKAAFGKWVGPVSHDDAHFSFSRSLETLQVILVSISTEIEWLHPLWF